MTFYDLCDSIGIYKEKEGVERLITDRNGREIKEGDFVKYVYGDDGEVGGLKVVLHDGKLMIERTQFFSNEKEYIDLKTTALEHCEVMDIG